MKVFRFDIQRFAEKIKTLTEGNDNFTFEGNMEYNESTGRYDTDVRWIVYGLGGADTIKDNGSSNASVYGGAGNDSLIFSGASYGVYRSFLIEGNEDDDTIESWNGNYNTLDGGAGDDSISSKVSSSQFDSRLTVINGGAGSDTIYNQGTQALINGGADDDTITNTGSQSSIEGSAGNDSIVSSGSTILFRYNFGDGKDTVVSDYSNDSLAVYSTQYRDDFLVKVGSKYAGNTYTATGENGNLTVIVGSGSVTFKDIGETGLTVNENDSTDFHMKLYSTKKGAGFYYANDYAGAIVHGLGGNDTIKDVYDSSKAEKTDSIQVYARGGDDWIENSNSRYALLDGGADDDTITNSCTSVTINGGDGHDLIKSSGNTSSIMGGAGNDSISNDMMKVTIRGGAGNDNIVNQGSILRQSTTKLSLLDGGDGDDYIGNFYVIVPTDPLIPEDRTTILGGAGFDTIFNDGNYNTIEGGTGNDLITLDKDARGNVIRHSPGDGNDTIYGFDSNDELIYDRSTTTTISGSDGSIILIDNSTSTTPSATEPLNLTVTTAATLISGTALADTIENYARKVTINGGKGSDEIINVFAQEVDSSGNIISTIADGNNASINGGDDDDYIDNYGAIATILGGAGNDYIYNMGKMVINGSDSTSEAVSGAFLLDGGKGNDRLFNRNGGAKILGGADNDSISNYGNNVSIDGGTNDDQIENWGARKVTITGGAGNDLITSTGQEILFNYALGDGNDTIYGFNAASTISVTGGSYSTIKSESGAGIIVMVGSGSILLNGAASLSSPNIFGTQASDSWTLDGTNAIYGGKVTVTGVTETDGLSISGKTVTVSASSLGTKNVSISDGYTLALGSNVAEPKTVAASFKSGVLTTKGTTKGYTLASDGKSITYTAATSKTIKFSGIADDATASNFYLSGTTITIGKDAVKTDGTPVKLLTSGYTLKLGKGMSASTTSAASYKNGVLTTKGTTDGYTLSADKKTISCSAGTSKTIKFSGVSDEATASNFYLSGTTITIGKDAVKTDGTPVKLLTSGYTLKLGKGMTASTTSAASYKSGVLTTKGTTEGYTFSADKKTISCSAGTSKTIKFSGVSDEATASNFYLSGTTITIGKDAVKTDGTPVKLLTSGYTLKLGKGMTASTTSAASYKSGVLTTKGTTEGYTLASDSKSIIYTAATSKTIKFSGVSDEATASNFYISGNVITVGKDAVKTDGTPVKLLTSGYTLKLGKGMSESETVAASYKNGVLTTKGTTDGYTLSADKKTISCSAGTSKTIKFSGVSDGATASNFYISGNVITVGKDAVKTDGTPVKLLTSGYTLKLGKGMSASETSETLKSGIYTFGGQTAGYVLGSDATTITCTAATNSKLKLSGVKTSPIISGSEVNLSAENFSGNQINVMSMSPKNSFDFHLETGNYADKIFTAGSGDDYIKSDGTNVGINGGAGDDILEGGAGDETLWGGAGDDVLEGGAGDDIIYGGAGSDIFLYKNGEGNDTIYDFETDDILMILKADDSQGTFKNSSFSGGKLTLTINGDGQVVFSNVSASDTFNINGTSYSISGSKLK